MRLDSEFVRLPLAFDVERLQQEALQFSEYEWDYHPQRYDGNTALNLVSQEGRRSDSYVGSMRPTDALERCPYIKQVMASFNTVIGRSRFMRLAPGKGVPRHSDTDYSWRNRVRIHIPIVTDPSIRFSSTGNIDVHMRAGEAWIFDNWREHAVYNESDIQRIHLVIDTVGTADFWSLADSGLNPRDRGDNWHSSVQDVLYEESKNIDLRFERFNILPVRSPDEIENLSRDFLLEIQHLESTDPQRFSRVSTQFRRFAQDWRALWSIYWDSDAAIPEYQALAQKLKSSLNSELESIELSSNRVAAYGVIANWLDLTTDSNVKRPDQDEILGSSTTIRRAYSGQVPNFDRPTFIVAAPRSGSTMLFEALKNNKELWTIGDESHQEIESIKQLHPRNRGFESNELSASDCTVEVRERIIDAFMYRLQSARSMSFAEMPPEFQPSSIRFLEKTPKNALRIPFFKAMFPEARFIYLYREPRANIGSIIDAWHSQKFVTYADLPRWNKLHWSLLLPQGWRELEDRPLEEVAAFQWAATNNRIMADLAALSNDESMVINYEALLESPGNHLRRACEFIEVPFGPKMQRFADTGFPNSKYAISKPAPDKWRRHEQEINSVEKVFNPTLERILEFSKR